MSVTIKHNQFEFTLFDLHFYSIRKICPAIRELTALVQVSSCLWQYLVLDKLKFVNIEPFRLTNKAVLESSGLP